VNEAADLNTLSTWQWAADMNEGDAWDYAMGDTGYAGLVA